MQYEEALKRWGADILHRPDEWRDVHVRMNFEEGFACCGGSDPLCYCSFAESPRAEVIITSTTRSTRIDLEDFDFAEVLRQIVEIGKGSLSIE